MVALSIACPGHARVIVTCYEKRGGGGKGSDHLIIFAFCRAYCCMQGIFCQCIQAYTVNVTLTSNRNITQQANNIACSHVVNGSHLAKRAEVHRECTPTTQNGVTEPGGLSGEIGHSHSPCTTLTDSLQVPTFSSPSPSSGAT